MSHRPRLPDEPQGYVYQPGQDENYEPVFTITSYYDGIRTGIASYQGRPHLFDSLFDEDELGGWGSFWLMPLEPHVFAMAMEDWHIWLRFQQSNSDYSQGPPYVLPEDRPRYNQLQPILEPQLEIDESRSIRALVHFNRPAPPQSRSCCALPVEALWQPQPHPLRRRRT